MFINAIKNALFFSKPYMFIDDEQDIIVPTRKTTEDIISLYTDTCSNSVYLKSNEHSLWNFLVGYYFSINNLLHRTATIQRNISCRGHDKLKNKVFSIEYRKTKSFEYMLAHFFEITTCSETSYNTELNEFYDSFTQECWIAFKYGYVKAEQAAIYIGDLIDSETINISANSSYTYYWDFLASELISAPREFQMYVSNYIDKYL